MQSNRHTLLRPEMARQYTPAGTLDAAYAMISPLAMHSSLHRTYSGTISHSGAHLLQLPAAAESLKPQALGCLHLDRLQRRRHKVAHSGRGIPLKVEQLLWRHLCAGVLPGRHLLLPSRRHRWLCLGLRAGRALRRQGKRFKDRGFCLAVAMLPTRYWWRCGRAPNCT